MSVLHLRTIILNEDVQFGHKYCKEILNYRLRNDVKPKSTKLFLLYKLYNVLKSKVPLNGKGRI